MPTVTNDTIFLFSTIGIILLIATIIGLILKKIKGNTSVISNLNTRIYAWWIMVIVIGSAFYLGEFAVLALFLIISILSLREFIHITTTISEDRYVLTFAYFICLPVQYLLVAINWYGLFSIFIPVYVFLLLPILASIKGNTNNFLTRTAKFQWGLMITVYCISYVPALLTLNITGYEQRNLLLIAFLVFIVQISDVLQYVFGKLWGKRKIAPNLSPSKTMIGFIGGIITASLIGMSLWWITPFSPVQAGSISLMITVLGFLGGLVMSAIKRDSGIKDWGKLIGGHGGMLDRLDSVCFAAPIFFHVVRYWWA